ncbi:polyketide synthase, enoylreductase [Trichoderma arundinaceum]|uniref:Polyketide synthase, enoylreductase n=1 Tax=Trichoderma arundinaceum TaxID=490622 RepID=A0A395NRB2_TRIAR|nr:polyketide synthase, enoylreductase [Trichoderma arundinaceum]
MPPPSTPDKEALAYRGQPLPNVLEDQVVPDVLTLNCDERLWVPQSDQVWFRPLLFSVSQGYFVNLLRVRKSGILSRHRHAGPVHATVLKGRWHYLEHPWWAEQGSYAFEPPGDIHTLEVPDDVEEMVTMFHVTGAYIYVDVDGNPVGVEDVFSKIQKAKEHYEKVGLGKDFVNQFIREYQLLQRARFPSDAPDLDVDGNFSKACDFIRQAAKKGAQLVVLPEYHLNGYLPEDPLYLEQATRCNEYVDRYCILARELGICLIPGTFVERHRTSHRALPGDEVLSSTDADYSLFNTSYFISHEGEILGSYRKKNLWHTERYHQSRGWEDHSAITTPFGKVGILICWDLAFPEAFRQLVRDGADIIIIPTCWTLGESSAYGLKLNPNYESLFLNSMITSRCFENTCAVVFANAGGPSDSFVGFSQVAVPFLGPINGIWDSSEGLFLAEIDMEVLKESELNYKVREDIARKDWHY